MTCTSGTLYRVCGPEAVFGFWLDLIDRSEQAPSFNSDLYHDAMYLKSRFDDFKDPDCKDIKFYWGFNGIGTYFGSMQSNDLEIEQYMFQVQRGRTGFNIYWRKT